MNSQNGTSSECRFAEYPAGTRYRDRNLDIEAVKVLPGEYCAAASDVVLVTVLGSCVSACIRDRELGIGGMNHFMLPDARFDASATARYGACAMGVLIDHLLQLGARRANLEAKVFGGSVVAMGSASEIAGVRNVEFIETYLGRAEIPIVARDLLGVHPRKVYYFPRSGRVLIRHILRLRNDTLAQREEAYARRIAAIPQAGVGECRAQTP